MRQLGIIDDTIIIYYPNKNLDDSSDSSISLPPAIQEIQNFLEGKGTMITEDDEDQEESTVQAFATIHDLDKYLNMLSESSIADEAYLGYYYYICYDKSEGIVFARVNDTDLAPWEWIIHSCPFASKESAEQAIKYVGEQVIKDYIITYMMDD